MDLVAPNRGLEPLTSRECSTLACEATEGTWVKSGCSSLLGENALLSDIFHKTYIIFLDVMLDIVFIAGQQSLLTFR